MMLNNGASPINKRRVLIRDRTIKKILYTSFFTNKRLFLFYIVKYFFNVSIYYNKLVNRH